MHAPQWIILALYGVTLLSFAHNHGKPRTGVYSFPAGLAVIAAVIGLLYWGGFFSH